MAKILTEIDKVKYTVDGTLRKIASPIDVLPPLPDLPALPGLPLPDLSTLPALPDMSTFPALPDLSLLFPGFPAPPGTAGMGTRGRNGNTGAKSFYTPDMAAHAQKEAYDIIGSTVPSGMPYAEYGL